MAAEHGRIKTIQDVVDEGINKAYADKKSDARKRWSEHNNSGYFDNSEEEQRKWDEYLNTRKDGPIKFIGRRRSMFTVFLMIWTIVLIFFILFEPVAGLIASLVSALLIMFIDYRL